MKEITVLNIKKIEGKPQLRAFANISVGEITINSVRLMEDPKGYWISFPQASYQGKDGKTKYSPYIETSEDLKKKIKDAIFESYQTS